MVVGFEFCLGTTECVRGITILSKENEHNIRVFQEIKVKIESKGKYHIKSSRRNLPADSNNKVLVLKPKVT